MTARSKEPARKAKNLQYIRAANRAEIIRYLSMHHEATRLELAYHLQLSKMAISNIINEMLLEDLVIEKAAEPDSKALGQSGRKSTFILLAQKKYMAIGVYISRDELQGVIADISGNLHQIWRQPIIISEICSQTDIRQEFISQMYQFIDTIMAETTVKWPDEPLLGIGVCSIGPLDLKQGILLAPPNFHGIEKIEILSLLGDRYRLPVLLDNDMNAAAWGEHLYGAGQNCQHVVYVGLTNGIGAGMISYGRIFQGSEGFAGEVGHMSIQMDGPLCTCGQRGCLELYISVPVLLAKTECPDLESLLLKSQMDDSFRSGWLPDFVRALLIGLVNIANIIDPDIILIGNEGAVLAGLVIEELEEKTNQLAFQHRSKKIPVRLSKFGEKSPLIGAASLIFQSVFRGDLCARQSTDKASDEATNETTNETTDEAPNE